MSEPYEMASVTAVPEPGVAISLAAGALLLSGVLNRRRIVRESEVQPSGL